MLLHLVFAPGGGDLVFPDRLAEIGLAALETLLSCGDEPLQGTHVLLGPVQRSVNLRGTAQGVRTRRGKCP